MLVLSRTVKEKINIGPDIEVTIVSVTSNKKVRVGINAPEDVNIVRSEIKKSFARQPELPYMHEDAEIERLRELVEAGKEDRKAIDKLVDENLRLSGLLKTSLNDSNQVELAGDDFNNKDTEILSEIIAEALADRGMQTEGFSFTVQAYLAD